MIIEKKFTQVNDEGVNILSIGQRFKEEREKKGFSQEALSKILLTSRKTIVNWEADISAPDARQLGVLFTAGFDTNYITNGHRMPNYIAQDVASYQSDEVQAILEAFSMADELGRAAILAVAALIKK